MQHTTGRNQENTKICIFLRRNRAMLQRLRHHLYFLSKKAAYSATRNLYLYFPGQKAIYSETRGAYLYFLCELIRHSETGRQARKDFRLRVVFFLAETALYCNTPQAQRTSGSAVYFSLQKQRYIATHPRHRELLAPRCIFPCRNSAILQYT